MQSLQLELSDIKTRLFDTDVKMKASESKNGELVAKDADNQRKVKELSVSVKKYQDQLNDLERKNVYLEGKVSGLEVKLESELRIKSDLSAMQADCEDRLREARETNNRLDHTLNSFKEDAQKMQTGYQVLETQVQDLTDTNKKLIEVVKDVQGKEESLSADKTKLEGRVKRLSATVKEKDAAIAKLVQEKARVQQDDQAWNNGKSGAKLYLTSSTTTGLQIHTVDHTRTANPCDWLPCCRAALHWSAIQTPLFIYISRC